MATYTGIADENGDFIVPFSANYTSGQKITVTSEKSGAVKSIELYAPSEPSGGEAIQFSGTFNSFPNNIGEVTLKIPGIIGSYAFMSTQNGEVWSKATSLVILNLTTGVSESSFYGWVFAKTLSLPAFSNIPANAFYNWESAERLVLPEGVSVISTSAFYRWNRATYLELPASTTRADAGAFQNWQGCDEVRCKAVNPPAIQATTFSGIKSTCIFKVPAASVAAYQAAANWSAFAARIQAI